MKSIGENANEHSLADPEHNTHARHRKTQIRRGELARWTTTTFVADFMQEEEEGLKLFSCVGRIRAHWPLWICLRMGNAH